MADILARALNVSAAGGAAVMKKLKDMGDGTYAEVVYAEGGGAGGGGDNSDVVEAIEGNAVATGAAGSPGADVLTVQGIASMTPIKTDGSGVTQPVSLASLPALPAGTNNIGDVDVLTLPTLANVTTLATLTGSGIAHDAADSGNPHKVGGRAVNAERTPVANNDRADFVTDLVGKQIVLPYANPENFVSGAITTAMTGTTSTSLVAAPGSGLRNYITTLIVSNSHATVGTDVVIQDGSGGTTLMTIPAAAVYGGAVINLPVPLRQPTANTALFCANVTTGASTKVSAVGYKGA